MSATKFDYYEAPSDEVFKDIQECAIKIWETYDDTYGYASGKIKMVRGIDNVQDNAWTIVAMFDQDNINKLLTLLKDEAREKVEEMLNNMWNE